MFGQRTVHIRACSPTQADTYQLVASDQHPELAAAPTWLFQGEGRERKKKERRENSHATFRNNKVQRESSCQTHTTRASTSAGSWTLRCQGQTYKLKGSACLERVNDRFFPLDPLDLPLRPVPREDSVKLK